MADNEKGGEETSPRGVDWEVVSLTASAYAAAPGPGPRPDELDPTNGNKEKENTTEFESSDELFMSHHFVFPQSEHENLPLEADVSEIHSGQEGHNVNISVADNANKFDNSDEGKFQTEYNDDMQSVEYYEKGSRSYAYDIGLDEEGKVFAQPNLIVIDQDMLVDSVSESFHSGVHGTECEKEEPLNMNADSPRYPTNTNGNGHNGSNLPCQAWWKRHAISLYNRAKDANAVWSVVVAAAVMGLVIIGRRWQQDKWQVHQIKWRFSITDEVWLLPLCKK